MGDRIRPDQREILREIELEIGRPFRELPGSMPSKGTDSNVFSSTTSGPAYELDARGNVVGVSLSGGGGESPEAPLSSLPLALLKLRHLKNLDLRGNALRELPEELFDLEVTVSLSWRTYPSITLANNPLSSPPLEIVDQGRDAVLEFFRSSRDGSEAVNEIRIILVGEGGSGKTSLSRRLLGEGFDPGEQQTHGINIRAWRPETLATFTQTPQPGSRPRIVSPGASITVLSPMTSQKRASAIGGAGSSVSSTSATNA